MQKLASEFHKVLITAKQEKAIVGSLDDIILNPDTGKVAGILARVPGRKGKMAASVSAIQGIGAGFIMIDSAGSLGEQDEIVRIKEILDKEIFILGSKVIDEDGRNLGTVRDYSVNLKVMRLERIYLTSSGFLKILTRDLMIPESDIVKIEKDKITVRSGRVKSGKKVSAQIH